MTGLDDLRRSVRIASLFLQPDCDMACRFCASELGFSVMSFERAVWLLRTLHARGIRNVVFGGGEPFLWPHDLLALAGRAKDLGYLVQVITNGLSLPDGFEQTRVIDRFLLPLEAMDAGVHDALRVAASGHLAIVLQRIATLLAAERCFGISTVLTRRKR